MLGLAGRSGRLVEDRRPCYNRRVDPVTHTLVGVGLGNAFFRRRIGREAVTILAVASNLPDIDALVHFTGDPAAIVLRRTFGHSLFLIPLWAFLLSLIFKRFYPRIPLSTIWGLSLAGAYVHLFFDLVNSFGVVLLWPFSDWRPELGIIFIIDLTLTGLLAAPLILCVIRRLRTHLVLISRISMACVAGYILFCGAGRAVALGNLVEEASRLGIRPDFQYVFPEPLGPHRWKGVLREGNQYSVFLIHVLENSVEKVDEVHTERGDPAVEKARKTALARRLEWFFKAPVWTVETNPGGDNGAGTVMVFDLRFRSVVLDRKVPFRFEFRLENPDVARPGHSSTTLD